jgi:hypothetical protein
LVVVVVDMVVVDMVVVDTVLAVGKMATLAYCLARQSNRLSNRKFGWPLPVQIAGILSVEFIVEWVYLIQQDLLSDMNY